MIIDDKSIIKSLKNKTNIVGGIKLSEAFLNNLPKLISKFLKEWELTFIDDKNFGLASCCLNVKNREGLSLILKIPFYPESGRREYHFLETITSTGITPKVFEKDYSSGSYLIEKIRINEGSQAKHNSEKFLKMYRTFIESSDVWNNHDDEICVNDSINLESFIKQRFEHTEKHLAYIDPKVSQEIMLKTEELASVLIKNSENKFVTHGDLHPFNVLVDIEDNFWMIDPYSVSESPIELDIALWTLKAGSTTSVEDYFHKVENIVKNDELLYDWISLFAIFELHPGLPDYQKYHEDFLKNLNNETISGKILSKSIQPVLSGLYRGTP